MIKDAYMRNGKGYTLLELLVVVAIIGLLAVIAIPGYLGYQRRAVRSEAFSTLEALRLLQEQFFNENNRYNLYYSLAGAWNLASGNVSMLSRFEEVKIRASYDGGENWFNSFEVEGAKAITSVVIDPLDVNNIYASSVGVAGGHSHRTSIYVIYICSY